MDSREVLFPSPKQLWEPGWQPDTPTLSALQISPVAWRHINCYGRYASRRNPIDVDAMVEALMQIPCVPVEEAE